MSRSLRALDPCDLDAVLALNQEARPAVGSLDREALAALVAVADRALVAVIGDTLAAFALVLGPGAGYDSENYRWFCARYHDFAYVDRIVVGPDHRWSGIGSLLYADIADGTGAPWMLAEVNLRPRNEPSLAFHARHGFETVGQQETEGGAKRVALMARALDPGAATRHPPPSG